MIIYFGIGTNLGEREANLRKALLLLDRRVGEQLVNSSVYYSEPQGFESDNEFANIVAVYQTNFSPLEVLHITQDIEREMGRTHKSVNGVYHDRVIDIDLLKAMLDNNDKQKNEWIHMETEELQLPHPRMTERDFVMVPLNEISNLI
jgi:2-amino-4-hydroxy-6-hydroxymethyldihydropteridine diphosphokinase